MRRVVQGSTLRRAFLLVASFLTAALIAWAIERAPMRAYSAIERQGSRF